MSLIVSRSSPAFGSVSAANERRWMSIRCGTSRGWGRREKLLRVTGAACERAKRATPQGRKGTTLRERFGQQRAQRRATHEDTTAVSPYARCFFIVATAPSLLDLDLAAGLL